MFDNVIFHPTHPCEGLFEALHLNDSGLIQLYHLHINYIGRC